MISETLNIANIKCSGCAESIRSKISAIEGVIGIEVHEDESQIHLEYTAPAVREQVVNQLYKLGYPEATKENGLLL